MTTPSEQQPREAGFFRAIRDWGITRGDNGFLGGVVDGLAQRVGMATVPARIIVVVAALVLNGLILITYAAAWALLPDRRGNIIIQNFGRGVPNVGALIGIGILTLFGTGGLDQSSPFSPGIFPFGDNTPWSIISLVTGTLVSLAFVGGVIWFIITMVRRSQNPPAAPQAGGPSPRPAPEPDAMGATPTQEDATTPESAPEASPASATAALYAALPTQQASTSAAPTQAPPAQPMHYPTVPPAPPARPRVPGPGRSFYLTALAWIVLSGAAVGFLAREDQLAVHPAAAWFVLMVTGLGVLLMAVSLAGRKLGFMGFMAIVLALPLPVIAAGADDLRDAYANDGNLLNINIDLDDVDIDSIARHIESYDATSDFADVYTEVVINGDCRNAEAVPTNTESSARLSFESLEADATVDVVSQVTYVTIPEGTDLNVVGQGDAQAHVVWPDRGITCDFWDAGGEHLVLANNVGPGVTLVVHDDAYNNTIVITEVSS